MRSPFDNWQMRSPFPGGGSAFDPATIMDGWWDAARSYTGTTSNVTALPDLTGNGNDLTYYSDTTAATITTLNGLDVVQMPATADDQSLYSDASAIATLIHPNNDAPFTVAGVARYTDLSADQTLWGCDNTDASFDMIQYYHRSNGIQTQYQARASGGTPTTVLTSDVTPGTNTTFAYVHVFDGAGGVKEWMNGAFINEYSYAPTGTFGTRNSLSFGGLRTSATGGSGDLIGVLGAMGVAGRALTDTEAAQLAGYLQERYGA